MPFKKFILTSFFSKFLTIFKKQHKFVKIFILKKTFITNYLLYIKKSIEIFSIHNGLNNSSL